MFKLEYEIGRYAITERYTQGVIPFRGSVGDIVAVLIPEWDKWVRARIECPGKDVNEFMVWCNDYAMPVFVDCNKILPLPEELGKNPLQVVFLGGIANCVPLEVQVNTNNLLVESKLSKKWSNSAIEKFASFVKESKLIRFTPLHTRHNCRYGNVEFSIKDKYFPAVKILSGFQLAIESQQFIVDLDKLDTYNNTPYKSHTGSFLAYQAILSEKHNSAGVELNSDDSSDDNVTLSTGEVDDLNRFFDCSASVIACPVKYSTPNPPQQSARISMRNQPQTSVTEEIDDTISEATTAYFPIKQLGKKYSKLSPKCTPVDSSNAVSSDKIVSVSAMNNTSNETVDTCNANTVNNVTELLGLIGLTKRSKPIPDVIHSSQEINQNSRQNHAYHSNNMKLHGEKFSPKSYNECKKASTFHEKELPRNEGQKPTSNDSKNPIPDFKRYSLGNSSGESKIPLIHDSNKTSTEIFKINSPSSSSIIPNTFAGITPCPRNSEVLGVNRRLLQHRRC